jgi:hypothetical protein
MLPTRYKNITDHPPLLLEEKKKKKKIEVKNAKTNSTFSYGSTSYLAGADILVQHKCVNDMIYFKSFRLIDNFVPQLFPATILFFLSVRKPFVDCFINI